jgi:hypothetical protein
MKFIRCAVVGFGLTSLAIAVICITFFAINLIFSKHHPHPLIGAAILFFESWSYFTITEYES